jgi:MFS family permease
MLCSWILLARQMSAESPKVPSPSSPSSCQSRSQAKSDRQYSFFLIIAVIYFLSLAISSIPLILLINQRIAGDPNHPSSQSAFVVATSSFLHSFISFLFGRYVAGLSDYLGRRPLLFVGALLSLFSRIIYLQSTSSSGFYFGSLIGAPFSCFYFLILALISDHYPDPTKRSKRVGMFTGLVGGIAFIIGVPLGSALATHSSPAMPIRLSLLLLLLTMAFLLFFPFDDTIAVEAIPQDQKISLSCCGFLNQHRRSLPADWTSFLLKYFPIYFDSQSLMTSTTAHSSSPSSPSFALIWLVNFLMHCLSSLLFLIFIQYCLAAMGWSPALASGSVLFVGICLGVLAPSLLHAFDPIALAFYLMSLFVLGSFFLAVAGTGLSETPSLGLGLCGVLCLGLGTTWVPSLHAIILPQYTADMQGRINGLLSQQNDASVLPAYVMSLGFTLSLRQRDRTTEAYWPGSAFGAVRLTDI